MRVLLLVLALISPLLAAPAARAQDDDGGGFLTGMIEDALSSDGQQVRLFGFEGALSSRARFRRLTIADADGIWLTVEGAELNWTRSALLRGRLEVEELTAQLIDLERLPPGGESPGGTAALPSPTSTAVNLPSLPVAVNIGRIAAQTLRLGPAVLGEELRAGIDGSLSLDGGNGAAVIAATRTDGKTGRLALDAAFSNDTRDLKIDMQLIEGASGILANMLDLPGRPSVAFTIRGAAPISDFAADIRLETDGAPRVTGMLRFMDLPEGAGLGWGLDLDGDVSPLFQPDYRQFFGSSSMLAVQGQNLADGGLRLDRLRISSSELDIEGTLELAADGMPRRFDLAGLLDPSRGDAVLLPLSGPETRLGRAELRASFDAAAGDAFTFATRFDGFSREDLQIAAGSLSGTGSIRSSGVRQVLADLVLDVTGLATGDGALDTALGGALAGTMSVDWTDGGSLILNGADLAAGPTRFRGDAAFSGLGGNLRIETDSRLTLGDLSRFAALAGQPLSGAAEAGIAGHYEVLGGAFDLRLDARTQALALAEGLVNDLAGGDGQFSGRISRGPEGTLVDGLRIETRQVSGSFDGSIGAADGDLTLDARLADLALLYPALPGPVTARGTLGWQGADLRFDLTGALPGEIALKLAGTATADGKTADVVLDAGLPDVSVLLADFSGPLGAKGSVRLADGVAVVDLATDGPEGAALHLAGSYALETALADLTLTGTADLSLANRFTGGAANVSGQAVLDLSVKGPAEPASVGGTLRAQSARIELPDAGITLPQVRLVVTLDPAHPGFPEALLAARIDAGIPLIEAPGADWLQLVEGPVELDASVALLPGGAIALRGLELANGDARITGSGDLAAGAAGQVATADLRIALGRLERLRPLAGLDLTGRASADVALRHDLASGVTEARLAGSAAGLGLGEGPVFALVDPALDFALDARLAGDRLDLTGIEVTNGSAAISGSAALAPLSGAAEATADLRLDLGALGRFSALAGMPLGGSASLGVTGSYGIDAGALAARIAGDVRGLTLGGGALQDLLGGDASVSAGVVLQGGALRIEDARYAGRALAATGSFDGSRVELSATLDNLGRVLPELPGAVTLRGSVGIGDGYDLDLTATGPGGINARVSGPVSAALVPRLAISGTAPLAVANPFIGGGIDVLGNVAANLTLNGSLDLAGLGGTLSVTGGRVAMAGAGLALNNLAADVALASGQARIEARTGFNTAGSAVVSGSIGLTGAMPADLALKFRHVEVVQQPTLRTVMNGDLTLSGPLLAGGRLAGRVDLDETEISLDFAAGGSSLLAVDHVGEPAASRETRARAGLLGDGSSGGAASGGGGNGGIALDITVSAPNQVFIRGRGLDTELGGEVQISGTTANPVPSGGFQLIRGRLDILGRRLDVTEGSIRLMGNLDPEILLVATTSAEGVSVNIVTEGSASDPRIRLTSAPELPEEEVLALLLFGRALDQITPLQALQLANAVRTLLSGGEGIQGRLRQQFGLDELDVTTDADGNVALRAGRYLSDNVYINTEVGASGEIEVQLNLDLSPSLTVRGSAGSTGNTSLGIFFERDY